MENGLTDISTLTLDNGVVMPRLGYGLFLTPAEDAAELTSEALRAGYRLIDTAAAYGNERGVGDAIRDSGLDRSEIFIETKIWISDFGYDETLHAFDKSATKLGVDQPFRPHHRRLPRPREAARRQEGARDWCEQL